MFRNVLLYLGGCGLLVWSFNSNLIADMPEGETRLIAHRGVHQIFSPGGIDNDTCTATRILPPENPYLENTIDSMRAAFDAGADVVELDVHLTPDKKFAVFHDWTLDCRTDGRGVTEETSMAVLKGLDIGYGYTADGGKTFPFRGKGVGLMPTLDDVLEAFPDGRFIVNFKSRRAEEGEALAALLQARPDWRPAIWAVYGGGEPTEAALAQIDGLSGFTAASAKSCLLGYLATGWIGFVPESCRDTIVPVPQNYAWLLWGWPNRFVQRMQEAGSEVVVFGPYGGDANAGVDWPEDVAALPSPFPGYIWTNRIVETAPLLRPQQQ
ncbi:glycerophosphodiester phosphodiesterase family protein [Rhizobium sp. GN54]|uniref:glycerophosphodiester phosphodiesterase family protein n=1 Tax=Rhizobium sp. GN54 TaxID=2898150 RepID=UPI001E2AD3AA|nr:glycerophosphodiester phosphodiesterase family protein [Rhizobium sp. GN54]MCD2181080.1 glycerophosphodiester phosphodiesterase [Rhizobium sp. GN54]